MRRELSLRSWSRGWVPVLLLLFMTACASHQIDWAARIGNYTFDQAVHDFGPPVSQAKLDDGALVAEWLTQRGYTDIYHTPFNNGYYGPRYAGSFNAMPVTTSTPDRFLRLTFDAAGRLTNWKNVTGPQTAPWGVPR